MATILVTGASGFVGSYAVPELIDAGHRVVALVRDEEAARAVLRRLPADRHTRVEFRTGDVNDPDMLPEALEEVDGILHLVAIPRDRGDGQELMRVNTVGTQNMVEAARTAGVRRFVHLGGLGVADDPDLHFARSKARGEQVVAESGLDWTILKPSLLWGPRDGFFNIVAGLARMSPVVIPVPGRGRARFQPLAVTDLARIVRLCFEWPSTAGQTYELGGPAYWTYREIVAEVLRATGRRRRIVPMPLPLIRLVAGLAERLHVPFPVATDQLRQLRLDNVGPLDGVERAFGFPPRAMDGQLAYLRRSPRDQDPAAG